MTYREQERIFDILEETGNSAASARQDKILKLMNSLATGYEYAAIKHSRSGSHWQSTIHTIRAQGIREAMKAIEELRP